MLINLINFGHFLRTSLGCCAYPAFFSSTYSGTVSGSNLLVLAFNVLFALYVRYIKTMLVGHWVASCFLGGQLLSAFLYSHQVCF